MRLRHIPGSEDEIKKSTWVYQSPEETQKSIKDPLFIEIGMGKGRFIIDNAFSYPDINFIGIEMYESVMVKATRRLDALPREEQPKNLHFVRMDARDIKEYFPPESVDRIYLNFSDPWSKTRHAHRRLPSALFLNRFNSILKTGSTIEFKTDNLGLFEFALEEYEKAGFTLIYKTYDLHADEEAMKSNIMTEYEEKFSAKGNKICKYIICKTGSADNVLTVQS
ncbi:MAG: tRNA (guanosine(46)-N7)-methyltransferase TrmB [Lachnospiraceae bacterium]|nr:tRNA (guanosine(46)-N7)-methyltransferase TrmB [Lachnospiraceae bacterium]